MEGNVTTIHCTYDPDTRSGRGINSNRKVKVTMHWVSAAEAIDAEVRLYDRLFKDPDPAGHKDIDFKEFLNENSLKVLTRCKLEPSLKEVKEGDRFQFQRLGYFCVDKDSQPGKLVFIRTVGLKDTWAKQYIIVFVINEMYDLQCRLFPAIVNRNLYFKIKTKCCRKRKLYRKSGHMY